MSDWWKAPVLQGPENDYGDYDYLIEEIPQDYAKWVFDKQYRWKCDSCGKDSHLLFRSAHYFHTLDGWDSMDYAECWKCVFKSNCKAIKWKLEKKIKTFVKTFKDAIWLTKTNSTKSFKYWYTFAKKINR